MKERLRKEFKTLGILVVCGFAYLIFVLYTGFGIPCVFNLLTGLYCPSCGITHMVVSMAKLEFTKAFWYNPVLFVTLPFVLACFINQEARYVKSGQRNMNAVCKIFLWAEILVLVIYGVIRNIG